MGAELVPQVEFSKVGIMLSTTNNQKRIIDSVRNNTVTIVHGPAGTGKTYIALAEGLRQLVSKIKNKPEKIIFIRPIVEAQEKIGFLPGEIEDKIDPYMGPLWDNAQKIVGEKIDQIRTKIEIVPIAYSRGLTFEDCYVIIDEAQNTNPDQMKLLLSRIGKNSRYVVAGDTKQSDIGTRNGLVDAIRRLDNIIGVGVVRMAPEDNMRHGIVREILAAYEDDNAGAIRSEMDFERLFPGTNEITE